MHILDTPESVGLSARRLARIRPWMERYVEAGKLPGATAFVARHGRVAYCESVGYGDREAGKPLTTDMILRFYSMTKPVTAVAMLMLYEKGLFQLDDPVAEFIPSFGELSVYVSGVGSDMVIEPARRPVTVHHLLTHTAGLTYGFGNADPISKLYVQNHTDFDTHDGPLAAVVDRLAGLPLVNHPGERWNYGVSFDVLGRLVEVLSGQSYDLFLQEQILGPLGMTDTGFTVPAEKVDRFAALYECTAENDLALMETPRESPMAGVVETFSGGGGLVSTLSDYYRFTEMLRNKGQFRDVRLLGRKTVEYMTCNHLPGDLSAMGQASFNETSYEGVGFGLGVSVMLDPARAQVLGTPGEYAWGGYASTAFWIDPVEEMTVIFLTQLIPSSAYPIRRELRVLTYQALIE